MGRKTQCSGGSGWPQWLSAWPSQRVRGLGRVTLQVNPHHSRPLPASSCKPCLTVRSRSRRTSRAIRSGTDGFRAVSLSSAYRYLSAPIRDMYVSLTRVARPLQAGTSI